MCFKLFQNQKQHNKEIDMSGKWKHHHLRLLECETGNDKLEYLSQNVESVEEIHAILLRQPTMHDEQLYAMAMVIEQIASVAASHGAIESIFKILSILFFHQEERIFIAAMTAYRSLMKFMRCLRMIQLPNALLDSSAGPLTAFDFYKQRRKHDKAIFNWRMREFEKEISCQIPDSIKIIIEGYFLMFDAAYIETLKCPCSILRMTNALDCSHENVAMDGEIIMTLNELCDLCRIFGLLPWKKVKENWNLHVLLSKLINGKYLTHDLIIWRMSTWNLIASIMQLTDNNMICMEIMKTNQVFKRWIAALNRFVDDTEMDHAAVLFPRIQLVLTHTDTHVVKALLDANIHQAFFKLLSQKGDTIEYIA